MKKSKINGSITSNILLIITAIVWGFAFVAQVKASNIGSFLYNGTRYLLGALILTPIVIVFERKKINRTVFVKSLISGVICGTVMVAAVNFQQYGINITQNAGKAGFITGLYIVFIPVVGIFFKQKTSIYTWIAVVAAIIGLFLICVTGDSFSFQFGDILVLVSALFWTAHIIFVDKFSKDSCPVLFSTLQFASCGIISMLISLFVDEISWSVISSAAIPILYGGVFSVGIGYTLQVLGQRNAKPAIASIALASEALFAAIGGVLILDEIMTVRQIIGAVLMFSAIILSQIKPKEKSCD